MIEDAASDLGIDPAQSWVIGDKWLDVDLGHAVGARSILVRTGWGADQERRRREGQRVDAICDNLIHAVSVIMASQHA
jgi:D-glycero-D-manno-heptose 1,7-bisphosphate phosphatase